MDRVVGERVKLMGEALEAVRTGRGLSRPQVAAGVGIGEHVLYQIERGIRGISGEMLIRITDYYGINLVETVERARW